MSRRSAALLSVAVLAACGGSSGGEAAKPATQIVLDAAAAAAAAQSVHVHVRSAGGLFGAVDLDLSVSRAGGRARMTLRDNSFDLVRIGDRLYVKANTRGAADILWATRCRFLGRSSVTLGESQLTGRWTVGSAAQAVAKDEVTVVPEMRDLRTTVEAVFNTGTPSIVRATKAGIAVLDRAGDALVVAANDTPYPVSYSSQRGSGTFTAWNEPVTLTAPLHAISTWRCR